MQGSNSLPSQQAGPPDQAGPQHRSSAEPVLRHAPGVRLTDAERALLHAAFPAAQTIFVEHEFRSGYSGALVLLVSIDSGQAPLVVKLAPPHDLQREYEAYTHHVLQRAVQNTARLRGAPRTDPTGQLGLLVYTFAGGNTQHPSGSLQSFFHQRGGQETVAVLQRIFRTYGRHWWAVNHPQKFVLAEEYDRLLPVHLEADILPHSPARPADRVIHGGQSSVVDVRATQAGDRLQLHNFRITKQDRTAGSITVTAPPPPGEASAPLRLRLFWESELDHVPGATLPTTDVRVRATRRDLLLDAARQAAPDLELTRAMLALPGVDGHQVPNPLTMLDGWLDRVVEARFSTIHGDLNVHNILVDPATGFAWLIDFADTREGPTLIDLQRLEVQVWTKLLPERVAEADESGSDDMLADALTDTVVANLAHALHADPPPARTAHTAYQEAYTVLVGIRRLARQYLMDDLDWDEYYLGTLVALVGTLKYSELNARARRTALVTAGTVHALLGVHPHRTEADMPQAGVSHVAGPVAPLGTSMAVTPPPRPAHLPSLDGFVGRAAELEQLAAQLERDRLVVITGMAGVGKTALAATLARWTSRPETIFWHSLHRGDGVDSIVWQLAAFLAHHGQAALWQLLERTRLTGGRPPQPDTLFDYLAQLLRAGRFLLCFDDFHFVEDDPSLLLLLRRLRTLLPDGHLRLLITTRRVPDFVTPGQTTRVDGLSRPDTRRLLAGSGLTLDAPVIDELHKLTGGNAQFLVLATDILQQAADPLLLLDRLAAAEDIERYLLRRVDEGLSGTERAVMNGIAIFLGHPATRDAIETVLNAGNVWRTLHLLRDRHLLVVTDGADEPEYALHAMVQHFYYQEASRRQRRVMHERAGAYYVEAEPDPLRAAIHYERAAAFALAVQQATSDVWAIINQGRARTLGRLLVRFNATHLSAEEWAAVNVAKGATFTVLDQRTEARESYQQALEELRRLPASARIEWLKTRVYRGMGDLLELEDPAAALRWIEAGMAELAAIDPAESAALHIKRGTAQMYLGEYDDALNSLEIGLRNLPPGPSQLRSMALMNLGSVHFYRGQIQEALASHGQALVMSHALSDSFQTVNVLIGMGISKFSAGQWDDAIADFKEALTLADTLGSGQLQAFVGVNLGAAFIHTGADADAETQLARSLTLAQANKLNFLEAFAQYRMADLRVRQQDWAAARLRAAQAEEIARRINHRGVLIAIFRAWAEIVLAEGDVPQARRYAEESITLARELGEAVEEGEGLRVLGHVLAKEQARDDARDALEASLHLLADQEPYSAARTMVLLGLLLLDVDAVRGRTLSDDAVRGRTLLNEAQATFRRLGARRDLEQLARRLPRPGRDADAP